MSKPNIVFIFGEQHNSQFLGCAGDKLANTPTLDRLAAGGARLQNCYCNSPLCVPSRSSLMTGRLPQDNMVYNNQQTLHSDTPTIAHALCNAGYETVLSGRMHFYGLDQYHGFEQRLVGDVTPVFQGHNVNKLVFGNLDGTMLQKRMTLERSGAGDCANFHFDRDVCSAAVKHMSERDKDRPLFMTLGLFSIHPPFVCKEDRYEHYYNLLSEPNAAEVDYESLHPAIKHWLESRNIVDITPDVIRRIRAAYYGMLEFLDEQVALVLKGVEEHLGLENTVIVYSSDHGESLGYERMYWKGTFYDTAAKVPAIIHWPKRIEPGTIIDGLTCLADLSATFLDIGGAMRLPKMFGRSLMPVLEGKEKIEADRSIISQIGTYPSNGDRPAAMIRKGRYKLVEYVGYEAVQLFDLESDPNEINDLGASADYVDVIKSLQAELRGYWDGEAAERYCVDFLDNFKIIKTWSNTTKFNMPERWVAPEGANYLKGEIYD